MAWLATTAGRRREELLAHLGPSPACIGDLRLLLGGEIVERRLVLGLGQAGGRTGLGRPPGLHRVIVGPPRVVTASAHGWYPTPDN